MLFRRTEPDYVIVPGWSDVDAEIDRCRRTGGSFVLVRIAPGKQGPFRLSQTARKTTRRERRANCVAAFPAPTRSTDRLWDDGPDRYVMLVDTDAGQALQFLARVERSAPGAFDNHVITMAAFPAVGLTLGALVSALWNDVPLVSASGLEGVR